MLGVMYYGGKGVPQDYAEAVRWCRKAADAVGWTTNAQFALGLLYYEGKGVAQNYAEAALWYRKAASDGDVAAQSNLGYMYSEGKGLPQSYTEAAYWYQKAADQGDANAQANLGRTMYRRGNYAEAYKWMSLAVGNLTGDAQKNAIYDLDTFARKLRSQELAEAKQHASPRSK